MRKKKTEVGKTFIKIKKGKSTLALSLYIYVYVHTGPNQIKAMICAPFSADHAGAYRLNQIEIGTGSKVRYGQWYPNTSGVVPLLQSISEERLQPHACYITCRFSQNRNTKRVNPQTSKSTKTDILPIKFYVQRHSRTIQIKCHLHFLVLFKYGTGISIHLYCILRYGFF